MVTKKLVSKINSIVENKKQNIISTLELKSPWIIFLNWLLTNWVTIILIIIISFISLKQYIQLKDVQELLLKKEIEALNIDLEKAKLEKEKLLGRVKDLENLKNESINHARKTRKEVIKLSSNEKKELLLQYKDRLLKKKGL